MHGGCWSFMDTPTSRLINPDSMDSEEFYTRNKCFYEVRFCSVNLGNFCKGTISV